MEQQFAPQPPKKKSAPPATIGLLTALIGLGSVFTSAIASALLLFFGPLIMCGTTIFVVPLSLVAMIMGWKGREESPKQAWAAIIIGALLVPLSWGLLWIFGEILGRATA